MKTIFCTALLALTLLVGAPPPAANAAAEVSLDLFYNALEPQGEWLDVADYGFVWHPGGVTEGWRPYTEGHWVFTDAGWTFVSDEPWAWATYHYGRWVLLADVGWVWVPDVEWAPAWVAWRRTEDRKYVGWAPLPPEARLRRDVPIESWADSYYDIGPEQYTFVESRNFGRRRLREVIVEPRRNVTLITRTVNITRITYQRDVVYVGGPEYEVITRESEEPIPRLVIERRTDVAYEPATLRTQRFASQVQGDRLQVVAPVIRVATAAVAPPRVTRTMQTVRVERGWQGVPQAEVQQIRTKIKTEAKLPAALPPTPKFEKAAVTTAAAGASPAPTAAAGIPGGTTAVGETSTPGATETPTAGVSPAPAAAAAGVAASPSPTAARAGSRKTTAAASPAAAAETGASPTVSPSPAPARRGKNARAAAGASPEISPTTTGTTSPTSAAPATTPKSRKARTGASPAPDGSPATTSAEPGATTPATEGSPAATPARGKRKGAAAASSPATSPSDNTGTPAATPTKSRKAGGAAAAPTESAAPKASPGEESGGTATKSADTMIDSKARKLRSSTEPRAAATPATGTGTLERPSAGAPERGGAGSAGTTAGKKGRAKSEAQPGESDSAVPASSPNTPSERRSRGAGAGNAPSARQLGEISERPAGASDRGGDAAAAPREPRRRELKPEAAPGGGGAATEQLPRRESSSGSGRGAGGGAGLRDREPGSAPAGGGAETRGGAERTTAAPGGGAGAGAGEKPEGKAGGGGKKKDKKEGDATASPSVPQ